MLRRRGRDVPSRHDSQADGGAAVSGGGEAHPPAAEGVDVPAGRRRRVPWWAEVLGWLGAAVVVALLLQAYVVAALTVPSASMEPTLHVGERVLVEKVSTWWGTPHRGDVVVFDGADSFTPEGPPGADPHLFVKRVIGVGGDRVTCCDATGRLTVNGQPLDEPYLYPGDVPSEVRFDLRVPAGKLFVLGDHRSVSQDSRSHLGQPGGGMVPVDRVVGRVVAVVWPPSSWRTVAASVTVPAPTHVTEPAPARPTGAGTPGRRTVPW